MGLMFLNSFGYVKYTRMGISKKMYDAPRTGKNTTRNGLTCIPCMTTQPRYPAMDVSITLRIDVE